MDDITSQYHMFRCVIYISADICDWKLVSIVGNYPRKKKTKGVVQNQQISMFYYGIDYVG